MAWGLVARDVFSIAVIPCLPTAVLPDGVLCRGGTFLAAGLRKP